MTTKALGRLRRIEGQVQGIQRMVEEDKSCVEILLQLAAVQGAVEQVQKLLLGQHLETCVAEAIRAPSSRDRQRKVDELLDSALKSTCRPSSPNLFTRRRNHSSK